MGEVVDFPHADPVPKPTHDPFLDLIELRAIAHLVDYVQHRQYLGEAKGLAMARADYLSCHPDLAGEPVDGAKFIVSVITALSRLSTRQQAKVRHPARDRDEVQILLDEGVL